MDKFSNYSLEDIKDLERLYNLISIAATDKLDYYDIKMDEKLIYLVKCIFNKITIEKLDAQTCRIHFIKKNNFIFQDINYII